MRKTSVLLYCALWGQAEHGVPPEITPNLAFSIAFFCFLTPLVSVGNMFLVIYLYQNPWDFPGCSVVKNPPANVGNASWIPGSGRSPGKGNGNPLQYSCLGDSMEREAWWATFHGVTKESNMIPTKQQQQPKSLAKILLLEKSNLQYYLNVFTCNF